MTTRVLVLVNRKKQSAVDAEPSIVDAVRTHAELVDVVDAIDPERMPEQGEIDLAITLGGDGTILQAAKHCVGLGVPMLGVNAGKVGFMAGFEIDRFLEIAPKLLSDLDSLRIRRVDIMHARVRSSEGSLRSDPIALNDFVVTAGPPYGIIKIDIAIDGHPGPTIAGDGVIVSTPMGSTAYNVSSGGPIIEPEVEARIVTPIAAHSLSFRPIVARSDARITLRVHEVNRDNGNGTTLLVDGQPDICLDEGDVIEISRYESTVAFVQDPANDYWSTLIHKLGWALAPSAGGINTCND